MARVCRAIIAGACLSTVTAVAIAVPASAAPDTFAGTWVMTATGSQSGTANLTLTLTQDGSNVTGAFAAGGSSAGVNGAVSGNQLSATFSGGDLTGTFTLRIAGINALGSFNATLFGVATTGGFSGICTGGPCLANDGSSSTPAAPTPSPGPSSGTPQNPSAAGPSSGGFDANGDEQQILNALGIDAITSLPTLPPSAGQRGNALLESFSHVLENRMPLLTANLVYMVGALSSVSGANGAPTYPALNGLQPVILQMLRHAVDGPNPEVRQSFERAANRLVAFLVKYDTEDLPGASGGRQ